MLNEKFFQGKLCDSNLSYEFFPRTPLRLPLKKVGEEMHANGQTFDIRTEFVLVFPIQGVKVSLYPSGKVLVKNVNEEEKAKGVMKALLTLLNRCPSARNI
jgi:ArsR family metal-binding transcriptional regulator